MATKWYRYMVSYKFNNGSGRVFIDRSGAPIDTAEAVEEIEAGIRERSPHLGPLHADNIVLLREWSE